MNFYIITRKAELTRRLKNIYKIKSEQLKELWDYSENIKKVVTNKRHILISCVSILINIVVLFEAFLNEILEEIIYSDPKSINNEKIVIQKIIDTNNVSKTVRNSAKDYCNKYFYNSIYTIIKDLHTKHGFEKNEDIDIESLTEIHATRNCFVHNNGIVNDKYFELSRGKARIKGKDKKIPINYSYIDESFDLIGDAIKQIYNSIPMVHREFTEAKIIKIYWENTLLEKTLKFEDAWEVNGEDIHLKKEFIDRYRRNAFSHSEYDIVLFFLYIFDPYTYSDTKIDIRNIYDHFDENSNERKMVDAWLEAPFFF